jgi:hypothetical protein
LKNVAVIPGVNSDVVAAVMVSQHRKERDFSNLTPERDNSKPEECYPLGNTKATVSNSELQRIIIHGSSRETLNLVIGQVFVCTTPFDV